MDIVLTIDPQGVCALTRDIERDEQIGYQGPGGHTGTARVLHGVQKGAYIKAGHNVEGKTIISQGEGSDDYLVVKIAVPDEFKVGQELLIGADISSVIYSILDTQIVAANWDGRQIIRTVDQVRGLIRMGLAEVRMSITPGMEDTHLRAHDRAELIEVYKQDLIK